MIEIACILYIGTRKCETATLSIIGHSTRSAEFPVTVVHSKKTRENAAALAFFLISSRGIEKLRKRSLVGIHTPHIPNGVAKLCRDSTRVRNSQKTVCGWRKIPKLSFFLVFCVLVSYPVLSYYNLREANEKEQRTTQTKQSKQGVVPCTRRDPMSFSLPTTFHAVPHAGPQSFIRNHTASTPPPSEDMQTLEEEYSSVPGASVSSHSSPGSTADLKGTALPDPALVIFPTPPSHVPVHRQYHHHHSNNNASTSAGTSSSDSLSWHPSVPSVPVLVSAQHHPTPGAALPTASAPTPLPSGTALTVQKEPTNRNRRQKRLERNRESARLSRRRRKHYLEVLEEKVTQLSHAMDRGRRAHVAQANRIRQSERHEIVQSGNVKHVVRLETALSRTSRENSVTQTFRWQQLKSLCLPPSTKFVLWLTLQNDVYFRGGRAASERLSAARIGERVRFGNDSHECVGFSQNLHS